MTSYYCATSSQNAASGTRGSPRNQAGPAFGALSGRRPGRSQRGNTAEMGLDFPWDGNLVRVSSVADKDRQPPGRQQVMAERALRGTRLGATSYENDRNTDLAPRQDVPFDCPNGHHFSVPFAAEAELPPMWECRVCGAMAMASTGESPSPKKVKPPRSHWDMLMERRTVEDLEAVLAERLEVVKERRAVEARASADGANHGHRNPGRRPPPGVDVCAGAAVTCGPRRPSDRAAGR